MGSPGEYAVGVLRRERQEAVVYAEELSFKKNLQGHAGEKSTLYHEAEVGSGFRACRRLSSRRYRVRENDQAGRKPGCSLERLTPLFLRNKSCQPAYLLS